MHQYEMENKSKPSSVDELLHIVRSYWDTSNRFDHVTLDHRAFHIGRIVPTMLRDCYDVELEKYRRLREAVRGDKSSSVNQKLVEKAYPGLWNAICDQLKCGSSYDRYLMRKYRVPSSSCMDKSSDMGVDMTGSE